MNDYGKLIESHMISFKEVLLMNYKKIGLDETDTIIITLLHEQKKCRNDFLSIRELKKLMTLAEDLLSERLVNLINRGYIELTIEQIEDTDQMREKFSLGPTIDKLGAILEKSRDKHIDKDKEEVTQKLITYIEKTLGKNLSAADCDLVNYWLDEDYSINEIQAAILESIKAKKTHLKYADAILASRKAAQNREKVEVDPKIKSLLDQVNVRRNY